MLLLSLFLVSWFTMGYLLSLKLSFYSLVDVVWALSFPLLFIFVPDRDMGLTFLFTLWGLRLGLYLARRLWKHFPTEDKRYLELRRKWKDTLKISFFKFFAFQAVSVLLLIFPLLFVNQGSDPSFGFFNILGFSLGLIGILGESAADFQKSKFRTNPENKDRVCDVGLWRYSRHPNYFFDCVFWLGTGVYLLGEPWGFIALCPGLLMTTLILKVTGIPPNETESLKRYGDRFRDYQRKTPVFFPFFTRN
jgi:steroid 5-alpha reductase family enzyme